MPPFRQRSSVLPYIPQQLDHEADAQLRHGLGGIAGGVADGDATLLRLRHGDVVHAGKGHVDELQVLCFLQHDRGQGHIGQHDDIRVTAPFRLDQGVRVLRISHEGVAHGLQLPGVLLDHLLGHTQSLQQYDFHVAMYLLNMIYICAWFSQENSLFFRNM